MSKFYAAATAVLVIAAPTFSMAHPNIDYDPSVIGVPITPTPKPMELELSEYFLPETMLGFGGIQTAIDLGVFIEFDCVCNGSGVGFGDMGAVTWGFGDSGGTQARGVGEILGAIAGTAAGAAVGGHYGGNGGAGAGAIIGEDVGRVVGREMIDRGGKEIGKPFHTKGSKSH